MAARRLVIILLILLGISIFATALAPDQSSDTQAPPSSTAAEPPATATAPNPVETPPPLSINADGKKIVKLPLQVGLAYSLDVYSKTPDTVEIPAFGLTQAVDRGAPAHFDLLPDTAGLFSVKLLDAGRVAGRLKVSR